MRTHLIHNVERCKIAGEFRHRNIKVDANILVSVLFDDVVSASYTNNQT